MTASKRGRLLRKGGGTANIPAAPKPRAIKVKVPGVACYNIQLPEYFYAKVDVQMKKVTPGDPSECEGDKLLVTQGDVFGEGELLRRSCTKERFSVATVPSLDANNGRVVSVWARARDIRFLEAVVVVSALRCTPDIDNCPMPPTSAPTQKPTRFPTVSPTGRPTKAPIARPTKRPTPMPTDRPTTSPTKRPTTAPTRNPTLSPSKRPTSSPTVSPTDAPSKSPSKAPTGSPTTAAPTTSPSKSPTKSPTPPTISPTSSPTKSCGVLEASFDVAGKFELEEVAGADPMCWRIGVAGDAPEGAFVAVSVDILFPEATNGCVRDALQLFDGVDSGSGTDMSGRICKGSGLEYESQGGSIFVQLDASDESFGPGFRLTFEAKQAEERLVASVCSDEECLRGAVAAAPGKADRPAKGRRPKQTRPGKGRARRLLDASNVTLIELDADFVSLSSPIVVAAGASVILRPKAPRTSVVLDGNKRVNILVAGEDSHVEVRNVHFVRGFGEKGPGGAIVSGGTINVDGCSFSDNAAEAGGGAIYLDGGRGDESVVQSSFFHRNTATGGDGGAILVDSHRVLLQDNFFSFNQCELSGSVAFARNARITLDKNNKYQSNRGSHVFATMASTFHWVNSA